MKILIVLIDIFLFLAKIKNKNTFKLLRIYIKGCVFVIKTKILEDLKQITPEEKDILDGKKTINRNIYMLSEDNTINSRKLLDEGKLITMRKHTRFIDFPEHSHDYIELIYMCEGSTTHIVEGKEIKLCEGELLFLGQGVTHSIKKASINDIAVNFIILPHFFSNLLSVFEEETPLKRFIIDCLCKNNTNNYLHYKVSHLTEVQNLMENLLLIVMGNLPNKRKQGQMTTALLFMQLMANTESLVAETKEDAAIFKLLDYIETNFANASLAEAATMLHYNISWLSREILRKTGKTFTQLVQDKRLSQAEFLLKNTNIRISNISISVGYENISYFHRKFFEQYGMSPKKYRAALTAREDTF